MTPQTFWLENLKLAHRYNGWILSQILPSLGNRVLEVGCGNGNFTRLLAPYCSQLTAMDLNGEYVELARNSLKNKPQIKFIVGDVTKIQWRCEFDTVVMLDVLEHIPNDLELLISLYHSLSPEGKLIIKVPALSWLYGSLDLAIAHYRRYNHFNLTQVMTQAGFSHCQTWYFNLAGIPGWWLNSKVLQRTTPPAKQVDLFNNLVPLLKAMEDTIKPPIGLSVFAIGVKGGKRDEETGGTGELGREGDFTTKPISFGFNT